MTTLKEKYINEVVPKLRETFNYTNELQVDTNLGC